MTIFNRASLAAVLCLALGALGTWMKLTTPLSEPLARLLFALSLMCIVLGIAIFYYANIYVEEEKR